MQLCSRMPGTAGPLRGATAFRAAECLPLQDRRCQGFDLRPMLEHQEHSRVTPSAYPAMIDSAKRLPAYYVQIIQIFSSTISGGK